MGIYLDKEELSRTAPADELEFKSPVPTQIVSNGEFNPMPQTAQQKQVEERLKDLADTYGAKMGLNRRQFLQTSCGMAAAFVAMNQVFGPVWQVSEAEAADTEMMSARSKALKNQFIIDDQTHFVRDDFEQEGLLGLGQYASEHWNPSMLNDIGLTLERYKFENYLKEVYFDSETDIALLSGAPFDDPAWWLLSNDGINKARHVVNEVAGGRRLLGHFVITPGQDGWMDEVDRAIAEIKPEAWKGYTIGDPLAPSKFPWRLDDEKLMYPFYEKALKAGINTIAIHKGLLPKNYEEAFAGVWQYATVDDLPKAAKDWPEMNFVMYHSALRPFLDKPDDEMAEFEKSGYIKWSTDLARMPKEHGVNNVYAEIGTAFANSAVANPRFAAAFIGQLVNEMGADRVIWGTDSVWYGSPQWQIEAMRRLEIPEDMLDKMGWQPLGPADSAIKNQIFAYNSARLYKVDMRADLEPVSTDKLSIMKAAYEQEGPARSNAAYGYVAKKTA
ncbi:MAG: amidohydrolase [Rhodospirillaceae bacterium]|jgi:predicted TIM-barrel fold metal-dependent hydrolase|nr:amidohydrolase [Rhodospirillaceae bacterium]